jgi:glucose-6-phosphate 1-dehydrogenase
MKLPAAVTIVIFGGSGDLAHRKLLPALYNLHVDRLLPPKCAVVGVGRKEMSDDDYRAFAKDGVTQFSRRPIDEAAWETFAGRCASSTCRSTTSEGSRRSGRGWTAWSTPAG